MANVGSTLRLGVLWNNRIYVIGGNQRIDPPVLTYSGNASTFIDYASKYLPLNLPPIIHQVILPTVY